MLKAYDHKEQASKVVYNIGTMVSQLSKLELEARRSAFKSNQRVTEQLEKINTEINNLEQWLTLLLLY
jgi:phage host-nuclease inhibitor protein Gam